MTGSFLAKLAAVSAVALLWAAPAGAHAFLVRSVPASGASIEAPPTELRLFFTEPVRPAQPFVVERGGAGSVLAGKPYVPAGTPNEIVVPLKKGLGSGPYAVRWSEVDLADGHLISGAFIFSVGTSLPPIPTTVSQGGSGASTSAMVSRGLLLAGLLVAAGVAGFALLVRRRSVREDSFVLAAALGVAALGALLSVLLEQGAWHTSFGHRTLVGAGVAAAGAVCALVSLRVPAAVAAIALLALPTATGHASSAAVNRALAIPFDVLHMAAAALWIGGVVELALIVRGDERHVLTRRFAPYALGAVGVLAATGAVRAYTELGAVHQLWTTSYGQALLVKSGLFGGILALAALNRRRLAVTSIRAELVLLAVVIGAVAVLTNVRPGKTPAAVTVATGASASKTVMYAGEDDDLAVGVALTPRTGKAVQLKATVIGFKGNVSGLDLRFGVDGRTAAAEACGAGCYRATLAPAGALHVLSVRVAGHGRAPATLRFAAPEQWPAPQALDIVRNAEATISSLHSLVVHSHLASDAHHAVTTIYKMVSPDRLEYHNVGSSSSIIIGSRRWDRSAGGPWAESPQDPSLHQPAPFWSPTVVSAHVLRSARVDGHSVWVVSFLDPSTPAWFTAWIDKSSYRTLRLEMVAAAHFMRDRDGPFNSPITVEPPT